MRIRIDLKISIFIILFYLTKQLEIYLIIMLFAFLHELGHLITGIILKMKLEKFEVLPYGFCITFKNEIGNKNKKIEEVNISELKKVIVALAGPCVSFIIAIIYMKIEPYYFNKTDIIYSNTLIALFNLMPIYPLDGGRIIKGILHIKFGDVKSQLITYKISYYIMILLTAIASIAVYYYKNIAIFLICIILWIIFLKSTNIKNYQDVYIDK